MVECDGGDCEHLLAVGLDDLLGVVLEKLLEMQRYGHGIVVLLQGQLGDLGLELCVDWLQLHHQLDHLLSVGEGV